MNKFKSLNFLLLFFLSLSLKTYAGTENIAQSMCSSNTFKGEAFTRLRSDLKEVECDQINKSRSCARKKQKKVTSDELAKLGKEFDAFSDLYENAGEEELEFYNYRKAGYNIWSVRDDLMEKNGIDLDDTPSDASDFYQFPVEKGVTKFGSYRGESSVNDDRLGFFNQIDNNNFFKNDLEKGRYKLESAFHEYIKNHGIRDRNEINSHRDLFLKSYLKFKKNRCPDSRSLEVRHEYHPVNLGHYVKNRKLRDPDFELSQKTIDQAFIEHDYDAKKKIKNFLKKENNKEEFKKLNEHLQFSMGYDDENTRLVNCDPENLQFGNYKKVAEITPSCSANIKNLFKNNVSDMTLEDFSDDSKFKDFKKCIKHMKDNGHPIKKISIQGSSSKLNNTGDARKKFCKKGFKELSLARAKSAKKAIQDEFSFPSDSIKISSFGMNGASGPCPYELNENGEEVLKEGYERGGEKRKELDQHKYAKVNVIYEKKKKKINDDTTKHYLQGSCSKIQFRCSRDNEQYKFDDYKRTHSKYK